MTFWPDTFICPNYEHDSIVNVPHLVVDTLLKKTSVQQPSASADRVILLVIDALGWNLYQQQVDWLKQLLGDPVFENRLLSTFPSTTAVATTSLRTGLTPAQHGMLGYRMFLRELGVAGQMIEFSPAYNRQPDDLVRAGLKPELFVKEQALTQTLAENGIPTFTFKEQNIIHSSLSKIHDQGVLESKGFVTFADMCVQIKQLLEKKANEPMYLYAYWPAIDTLSHIHGWTHESIGAEFRTIFRQLLHELIEPLSPEARHHTQLWITADHGQMIVDPMQQIDLMAHAQLQNKLIMPPVGDTRLAYLYAKQGEVETAVHYINHQLGDSLFAISTTEAIHSGLFGQAPFHPAFRDRVGDIVVLAKEGATMFSSFESKTAWNVKGWHGSLTKDEMQVPLVAYKLG